MCCFVLMSKYFSIEHNKMFSNIFKKYFLRCAPPKKNASDAPVLSSNLPIVISFNHLNRLENNKCM